MDTTTLHQCLNAIGPEWKQVHPDGITLPCFQFEGGDKKMHLQVPFCVLDRIRESMAGYNEAWETNPTSVYDILMDDIFHADAKKAAIQEFMQNPDVKADFEYLKQSLSSDSEWEDDFAKGSNFGSMLMVFERLADAGHEVMLESFLDHGRSLMVENADVVLVLPYSLFKQCGDVISEYGSYDAAACIGDAISVVADLYKPEAKSLFCSFERKSDGLFRFNCLRIRHGGRLCV